MKSIKTPSLSRKNRQISLMQSGGAVDLERGGSAVQGGGRGNNVPLGQTKDEPEPIKNVREIHQKALDDLVNVNSLFTLAVFVGLSLARQGERSLENRSECDADVGNAKRLVVNEVVSFACFLLSSLVAKALKIHVTICQEADFKNRRNQLVRLSMLLLSVWSSVFGCIFLTVSMVDVIQIKVGRLSCRSVYAWRATGALIAIVLLALAIYVPFMMNAIITSIRNVQKKEDNKQ